MIIKNYYCQVWEVEAEEPWAQGHPQLHGLTADWSAGDPVSKSKKQNKTKALTNQRKIMYILVPIKTVSQDCRKGAEGYERDSQTDRHINTQVATANIQRSVRRSELRGTDCPGTGHKHCQESTLWTPGQQFPLCSVCKSHQVRNTKQSPTTQPDVVAPTCTVVPWVWGQPVFSSEISLSLEQPQMQQQRREGTRI